MVDYFASRGAMKKTLMLTTLLLSKSAAVAIDKLTLYSIKNITIMFIIGQ